MKKKTPLILILCILALTAGGLVFGGSVTQSPGEAEIRASETWSSVRRLALATLELEGTDTAIGTEQAEELLFLWKGVRSLNDSSSPSTAEAEALVAGIQASLTSDQLQAIAEMELSATVEPSTLPQMGEPAANPPAESAAAPATGGEMPGGEMGEPPADGMMPGMPKTSFASAESQPPSSALGQVSATLLEDVIQLLQEKSA